MKVSVPKEKEFRDFDKQLINTVPLKTGSIVDLLDSYSTTLQILMGSHYGSTKYDFLFIYKKNSKLPQLSEV